MVNTNKVSKSGNITGVSGNVINGNKTGDFLDMMCNKYGNEVHDSVLMKDMRYAPNSNFNLFSITKYMQKGWIPSGRPEVLWIEKDGKRINLDIKESAILQLLSKISEMTAIAKSLRKKNLPGILRKVKAGKLSSTLVMNQATKI